MKLTVIQAFEAYQKGDVISDPAAIKAALEHNPHHVVKIAGDPDPVPQAPALDAAKSAAD